MVALLGSMLLSLPGFYLVKNGVARDRETGVGQIIATTPLRKSLYTLGKAASNLIFLVVIIAVFAFAAGAMQFIRGEVLSLRSEAGLWGRQLHCPGPDPDFPLGGRGVDERRHPGPPALGGRGVGDRAAGGALFRPL